MIFGKVGLQKSDIARLKQSFKWKKDWISVVARSKKDPKIHLFFIDAPQ